MEITSVIDTMVTIPNGSISLRDDRKNTKWDENIKSFNLSKYLVTQDLYSTVIGCNPSKFPGNNKPVENISWFDAILFCNALSEQVDLEPCYVINPEFVELISGTRGFRLPTDAEWEYACRADTKKVQYGSIDDIAWYEGNSGGTTHEIGLKEPNKYGLFDMLGNVWEWCWDLYDPIEYGTYRIFRGGGWCDNSRGCLASNRRRSHPTYTVDDLGFRIASSI
jgi:formylglycine-generating enzyme required for sulfatase activity